MSRSAITIVSLSVAVAVLIAAWFVLRGDTGQWSSGRQPTRTLSLVPPELPVYRNDDYRFLFTYPSDWEIADIVVPPQPGSQFLAVRLKPVGSVSAEAAGIQVNVTRAGVSYVPVIDGSTPPKRRWVDGREASEVIGYDPYIRQEMLTSSWNHPLFPGRDYTLSAYWPEADPVRERVLNAYELILASFKHEFN